MQNSRKTEKSPPSPEKKKNKKKQSNSHTVQQVRRKKYTKPFQHCLEFASDSHSNNKISNVFNIEMHTEKTSSSLKTSVFSTKRPLLTISALSIHFLKNPALIYISFPLTFSLQKTRLTTQQGELFHSLLLNNCRAKMRLLISLFSSD